MDQLFVGVNCNEVTTYYPITGRLPVCGAYVTPSPVRVHWRSWNPNPGPDTGIEPSEPSLWVNNTPWPLSYVAAVSMLVASVSDKLLAKSKNPPVQAHGARTTVPLGGPLVLYLSTVTRSTLRSQPVNGTERQSSGRSSSVRPASLRFH